MKTTFNTEALKKYGAKRETGKAARLLNSAFNEGRKALRAACKERKGRDGISRHRYSNEFGLELHELYDMGTIEGIVDDYQRQQKDCCFPEIVAHERHLGYEGDEKYVQRLVNILIKEEVISYNPSTGRYSMSTSRTDKPTLMQGRQNAGGFIWP